MNTMEIDPCIIYHTHSRIRNTFSGCGKKVEDTLSNLLDRKIKVSELPSITVEFDGKNYYSLNNRRLYVIKKCKEYGLIDKINVRVKLVKNDKYRGIYSLNAKISKN